MAPHDQSDEIRLLFVYGTLRKDVGNPAHCLLARNASFFDYGFVRGRLLDLGRYPGMILSNSRSDIVVGELWSLHKIEKALYLLDEYEDVYPEGARKKSTYHRVHHWVTSYRHQGVAAWLYILVADFSHGVPISGGDYLTYLRSTSTSLRKTNGLQC